MDSEKKRWVKRKWRDDIRYYTGTARTRTARHRDEWNSHPRQDSNSVVSKP